MTEKLAEEIQLPKLVVGELRLMLQLAKLGDPVIGSNEEIVVDAFHWDVVQVAIVVGQWISHSGVIFECAQSQLRWRPSTGPSQLRWLELLFIQHL